MAVYKPEGSTSADVVQQVRSVLEAEMFSKGVPKRPRGKPLLKVGHGGTLDPLADGVLVVGVGTGCRDMSAYLKGTKRYLGVGVLGAEYDTGDCTGQVSRECAWAHVTKTQLLEALPQFRGEIEQVPPMFSALRKDGERLYDLARRGETVEREARKVTISKLELICADAEEEGEYKLPQFALEIECGGGTYVRTLIEDVARAVKSGAHMKALTRVKQGPFTLDDCLRLDAAEESGAVDAIAAHVEKCKGLLAAYGDLKDTDTAEGEA